MLSLVLQRTYGKRGARLGASACKMDCVNWGFYRPLLSPLTSFFVLRFDFSHHGVQQWGKNGIPLPLLSQSVADSLLSCPSALEAGEQSSLHFLTAFAYLCARAEMLVTDLMRLCNVYMKSCG